jgi:phosphoribosyl 1,2-cyclic phosphodiesterase
LLRGRPLINVSFYGVRGSTPCPAEENRRYGGNTSCVTLEAPGSEPVVLDLGTGLRRWGQLLGREQPFVGSALVTHLHWDHVQGLPFFVPVLQPGARLDIYGPPQDGETLEAAFRRFVSPPYFPVTLEQLYGQIRFVDVDGEDVELDGAKVRVRSVPHVGRTNGYRVEMGGAVVAYLSDHQMPQDGSHAVSDDVLELCDGADLVIHDAQYTREEFTGKSHWGHCTIDYALFVAEQAGARRLALFHHDPAHGDDMLDEMLRYTQNLAESTSVSEVISAYEGLTVSLGHS